MPGKSLACSDTYTNTCEQVVVSAMNCFSQGPHFIFQLAAAVLLYCFCPQVANFDMVAATEPEQQQQQQAPPSTDPTASQQQFWASLLKDHKPPPQPEADTAAAAAAAAGTGGASGAGQGSGRRRRSAKVSYIDDVAGLDWADLSSGGSESESESEEGGKGRKGKRRKRQEQGDEAWELPAEQVSEVQYWLQGLFGV